MLHHIQKAILDDLSSSESLRYGQLKPAELDGNVFGYHLKLLIRDRYITKGSDGSYALSQAGKSYIVNRYEDPLLQAHSIFLIIIQRGDSWLMRRRLVQPHLGFAGFIHGEPHADESVVVTAERRLAEKTGLIAKLSPHSSGLVAIKNHLGIAESYSHAIILTGTTEEDVTITDDATGEQFWCTTQDIIDYPEQFLPSCLDIINHVNNARDSFFELTYIQRNLL